MAATQLPIIVNGQSLDNGLTHRLHDVQKVQGILEAIALEEGATRPTFDGPMKAYAGDLAYSERRFVIEGRLINTRGFLSKWEALESLQKTFAGRPAIVRVGSLYLEAVFGRVEAVDDSYKRLGGYMTYRIEGGAVPGTFYGSYGFAQGQAQGVVVQDDRADHPSLKFAANTFTFTSPGTAPSEAVVAITGTANATVYLKGQGVRRVPVNLDAQGNGRIDEASGFIVYPGGQTIRVEDAARALASGVTSINFYGTRFRFLGNNGNRFAEGPVLQHHRTGSASHLALDGTLKTAGDGVTRDGVTRIGLPWVGRRNLLAWSEDLTQAAWVKTNVTIERARALGVGALYTADQVTVGSSGQALYQDKTVLPSTTYTLSFYAQRGTATDVLYSVEDLIGGTTITGASYYASINSGGLTRVSVAFATPAGCTSVRLFGVRGSAAGTVILTAFQLDLGNSASPYQPTNATGMDLTNPINGAGLVLEGAGANLLLYSQEFDNAAWAKQNADISANSASAPDDTSTADSMRRLAGGANHYVSQQASVTSTSGKTYTFSVWLKLPGSSALPGNVVLRVRSGAGVEYSSAAVTPTTDWQRYAVTAAFASDSAADVAVYIDPTNDTGVGGEAIYAWGAQLEESPFATSYIPTTSAAVARNADLCGIVPPHNLLKYSQQIGEAGWWENNTDVTPAANTTDTTAPDGTYTAAKLVIGTANHQRRTPYIEGLTVGNTYTASCWLKGTVGTSITIFLTAYDSGGNNIGASTTGTITASGGWDRARATLTLPANTVKVRVQIQAGVTTVYAWGAQLVEGSHPGVEVTTGDTPIPAPTSPALDPAWQQNGFIEWDSVNPSNVANTTAFYHFGSGITGYPGLYRYQWGTTTKSAVIARRPADGGTEPVSFRDVENIPDSFYAGARVRSRMEWANYTLNGVRVMSLKLTIDGALLYSKDFAALLGSTQWTPVTDASTLISGGLANATLSNIVLGYPAPPSGATPAT